MSISALATNARAQSFHEQCREDIGSFCSYVEPGDGRVAACLYAHTTDLSQECYDATDELARVMEWVFDRLADVYLACGSDIQEHCGDASVSGGRILTCLQSQDLELTTSCRGLTQTFQMKVAQ